MIADQILLLVLAILSTATGGMVWRIIMGRWPVSFQWPGLALPLGLGTGGTIIGISASLNKFQSGIIFYIIVGVISIIIRILQSQVTSVSLRRVLSSLNAANPSQIVLVLMLAIAWFGLHSPVIDGDALCYHLEVAKRMAQSGGLQFDADLHETAYPLVVESLQAAVLSLSGPVATRSVSFLFGVSLAYASALLALPIVGSRQCRWASVFVLCSPIVNCGMTAPLNDVALAALCVAAAAAWAGYDDNQVSTYRRCIAAGFFCGLACGVKFPGIVWAFCMGLAIFSETLVKWYYGKISLNKSFTTALVFIAFLIITGGFWYARAGFLTGNPVHPYFRETFGGNGLDEVLAEDRKTPIQHIFNIITAPIVMTLWPGRFDSFSHQIGPLFLALIPLGFLQKQSRRWYELVGLGWLAMALCLTQRQSPRFFISILGPWSAAATAVTIRLVIVDKSNELKPRRWVIISLMTILIASTSVFNIARSKTSVRVLAGLDSPSEWLRNHEPTALLASWVDSNLPPDARLVGQDHRGFYWPRPFTMEKAHRRRLHLLDLNPEPEVVVNHYLSMGFTHLVMAEPEPLDAVEFDPALSFHLQSWLASHRPVLDQTLMENDGFKRRYRIFQLNEMNSQNRLSPEYANKMQFKTDLNMIRTSLRLEGEPDPKGPSSP